MSTNAQAATANNAAGFININDLTLADEVMEGFDPAANQYAGPAPVPPGTYRVALRFADDNAEKRWFQLAYSAKYPTKAGRPYFKTRLVGTITDEGKYQGRRVVDTFMSTGIFDGSNTPGTSGVASLLHVLGRGDQLQPDIGQIEMLRLFEQAIAAEPTVRVSTNWEATLSKESGRQMIKGIKNFPKGRDGEPTHIVDDPATGEKVNGYAVIKSYFAG